MRGIPFRYNFRSILRRPARSLLTVFGVGLSIFLSMAMLGLSEGLVTMTTGTGRGLNLLVLSHGAASTEFSAIDPEAFHILSASQDIAVMDGKPLASPETYLNTRVGLAGDASFSAPVYVRGIREAGFHVHDEVGISEGRRPGKGREVAAGPLVATRLGLPAGAVSIGTVLEFEGVSWVVTGILEAPGTVFESEIWTDLDDLHAASGREDFSAIVLRARDATGIEDLLFDLKTRTDIRTTSFVESEYFSSRAGLLAPVVLTTWAMTALLVLGGAIAGLNTMFNSVMSRLGEASLLMLLGYRRSSVIAGFMFEGTLLCLMGGIAGAAGALPLSGLPMKFAMHAFRFSIGPSTIGAGIALALFIGVAGVALPVSRLFSLVVTDGIRSQGTH